mgnify:CR=1 FL=1
MVIKYEEQRRLISYVIDGKITTANMNQLQMVRDQIPLEHSFRVLAIAKSFDGYESFDAMREALRGDLRMLSRLSKYVLCTDIRWLRATVTIVNHFLPKNKLKAFPLHDRKSAEEWLE